MFWHIRNRWPLVALVVLGLSIAAVAQEDRDHHDAANQPSMMPAKTGAFVINFTQRSPLSDFDQLAVRLNVTKAQLGADYELQNQVFAMYVPANYDPSAPMGLLVYVVNHGTPQIYPWLEPILDQHHLIMIATQRDHLPLGLSAGLCLDAVFNVEKQYAIDPARIYLIGGEAGIEQIGWSTDDIFAGDTYMGWIGWFKRFGSGMVGSADLTPPPEKMLRLARLRPQVLAFEGGKSDDDYHNAVIRAMKGDGFEHVFVNVENGISASWFDEMLKKMESVPFVPPDVAATQPSTKPAQGGAYEITFTNRSPLSEYSKLVERLGATKEAAGPDYDLKDQPFAVYVPDGYDGSAAYGLLVKSFDSETNWVFEPTYPVFDKHHLIVVATEHAHLPLATDLGLCLDAVYNMQQMYRIDPKKIYLIGTGKQIMPVGMCSGDIFTGDAYIEWFDFYGATPGMTMDDPTKYKPSPRLAELAKSRTQIIEFGPGQELGMRVMPAALRREGFDYVSGETMRDQDFMKPEWLERVVTKLEAVHPTAAPRSPETAAAHDATTAPTPPPAKTGAFEITFTSRSPLSDYSKLLDRLGTTKDVAGPDYDLKDQPFAVYVPPDYDGSTPFGLMVQSFQDGSPEIYAPERPLLDAHHLIVVATEHAHLPLATDLGLCLDAVYNMQQLYHIDPSRIYLMGLSKPIMPVGMCSSDVFTGDVYIWWFDFYGATPGLIQANPTKYRPSSRLAGLAKSHMQVLEFNPEQKVEARMMPAALRQEGFDHVFGETMRQDDFLTPGWLEGVLNKLESVHAGTPRAAAASQPASDQPQRLLNLAQALINSGRPDLARAKLEQIIERYPDSPESSKAKALLDQINAQ